MHVTDRIKRAKARARGVWHVGTGPHRKIFDFRPFEIAFGAVNSGVKQKESDDQLLI